jgi:transcriptional regulator with XRE-family HTH domain
MATKIVGLILEKCYTTSMLTPAQSRAARGWLDWSQEHLAKQANVSLSTIRDFEKGRRTPIPNNLDAIQHALNGGGVRMVYRKGKPVGIAVVTDLEASDED